MGILAGLFGGGTPDAAPFMQRLTGDLGSEGGLLQKMGMGKFADQPAQQQDQQGGLMELLSQMSQQNKAGSQPLQPMQGPDRNWNNSGIQSGGLAQIMTNFLNQNRR